MTIDALSAALLRAVLVVGVVAALYGPVGWLERWGQGAPGERPPLRPSAGPFRHAWRLLRTRASLPAQTDRAVHLLAPVVGLCLCMCALASAPLFPSLRTAPQNAVMPLAQGASTAPLTLALLLLASGAISAAGWAGANRLALLGALRLTLSRTSALLTLGLSCGAIAYWHDSWHLDVLARHQARPLVGPLPALGAFVHPLGFLLSATALAVVGRRSQRRRDGEHAELIDHHSAEASGPLLLAHRTFEVVELLAVSALMTAVFFGGWLIPGVDDGTTTAFPPGAAAVRMLIFAVKMLAVIATLLLWRRFLPPLRHDQSLSLGWLLVLFALAALVLPSLLFERGLSAVAQ
ncbi:MAG: NADH-quinone oxidoreductase subunit H [Myxococcota bacterium]